MDSLDEALGLPTLTPTSEQQAIIEAGVNSSVSMMVTAYAGCAKTSTLEMLSRAMPRQPTLSLAFNVKIKKEMEKRLPDHFTIMTLNGLGHRAWQDTIGKRCGVEEKKLGKIVTEVLNDANASRDFWEPVRNLASLAMQQGLVHNNYANVGRRALLADTPEQWEYLSDMHFIDLPENGRLLAREVVRRNTAAAFEGVISYDDQIYMSTMFGGAFPKFPLVFVDEAQDLSPLNHIQVQRCAIKRIIVVGDPKQAIYAFRGADSTSMEKLRALRPEWIDLPLTVTFRCPQAVVKRQQIHAPGFTAGDGAPEGQVHSFVSPRGEEPAKWTWGKLDSVAVGQIAILCRNNAPLLKMAFQLIKSGVAPMMLGRDIGKGLVTLARKILPFDDIPAAECLTLISQWEEQESALARAKEQEEKVAAISDRAECLRAVIEFASAKNAGDLRESLEALFDREHGRVILATGHRAKGLEWDTVVHLDPWRVPSKYAKAAASRGDDKQIQQEFNLRYVIETRTKKVFVLANFDDFEPGRDK